MEIWEKNVQNLKLHNFMVKESKIMQQMCHVKGGGTHPLIPT
jgi:hypothetical protein